MPKERLTKTIVDRLAPGPREYILWDAALPGFGVRVKSSGRKSAVVQYRSRRTGESRRKTIGQLGPLLTLHQARDEARALLGDAARGQDPIREERTQRAAPNMSHLSDDYLERHAVPKKRCRSVACDQAMLRNHVLPALGDMKVADVSRRDLERLHNRLRRTPCQANRVLALLSKMFSLSIAWGWRMDNPARGIERFPEHRRERWLSEEELRRFVAALEVHPNQRAASAIRMQLLTGARLGEVLNARWCDVDLRRGVWTKPSHHTKQKRTEHLPLSLATLALLESLRWGAAEDAVWLFPGDAPGKPLQDIKRFWASITREAGLRNYRRHDNRHTHASYLVSQGLSLEIVGRLLGHTSPLTTRRYAHLADSPLRAATEAFGARIAALGAPGHGLSDGL
jgi:integrase